MEGETSPTKDSCGSVLQHLLSQSPKPATSTLLNNPFSYNFSQRASHSDNSGATPNLHVPHQQQHHCNTMPDIYTPTDVYAMMSSRHQQELPSFPVNVQTHEDSPTKSLGRHSPLHDLSMASISEDTMKETTGIPVDSSRVPLIPPNPANVSFHNGEDRQHKGVDDFIQSEIVGSYQTNWYQWQSQQQSYLCGPDTTQGLTVGYTNNVLSQSDNHVHVNTPNPPVSNPYFNPHSILNRISSVLSNNGIHYCHSNGGFVVEHDKVKLYIFCNLPHTIQMQYIAGDKSQYQTLSCQLAKQLQFVE